MNDITKEIQNLEKLNDFICELRGLLNDICLTIDEGKDDDARLLISQCLDSAIVTYMKESNSLSKK